MPAFLSQSRGKVARIQSESAILRGYSPFSVRITDVAAIGNAGGGDSRILITQVSMNEMGSFQLQHTFGKTIYAYIFGDRVGDLKLSGVCFNAGCTDSESGIDKVYRLYEQNRIAVRQTPMIITFSKDFRLIGLLTGMAMEMTDAETQLMQWSYRFNTFRAVG